MADLKKTAENLLLIFSCLTLLYEFIKNYETQCLNKTSVMFSLFAIIYSLILRKV